MDQSEIDAVDHDQVIEIVKDRYFKILQETQALPAKLETCSLETHVKIFDLKRDYFHKFTDEKDLYKFCLKSREIRFLLQVIFSVFNYCEEAIQGNVKGGLKYHATHKSNTSFSHSHSKPNQKLYIVNEKSKTYGSNEKPLSKIMGSKNYENDEIPFHENNYMSIQQHEGANSKNHHHDFDDEGYGNMTVLDASIQQIEQEVNVLNKSMSSQKKIRANRSVRAERAKSRQFRDPAEVGKSIGYEVDLNELINPPPLIYEVHGDDETQEHRVMRKLNEGAREVQNKKE